MANCIVLAGAGVIRVAITVPVLEGTKVNARTTIRFEKDVWRRQGGRSRMTTEAAAVDPRRQPRQDLPTMYMEQKLAALEQRVLELETGLEHRDPTPLKVRLGEVEQRLDELATALQTHDLRPVEGRVTEHERRLTAVGKLLEQLHDREKEIRQWMADLELQNRQFRERTHRLEALWGELDSQKIGSQIQLLQERLLRAQQRDKELQDKSAELVAENQKLRDRLERLEHEQQKIDLEPTKQQLLTIDQKTHTLTGQLQSVAHQVQTLNQRGEQHERQLEQQQQAQRQWTERCQHIDKSAQELHKTSHDLQKAQQDLHKVYQEVHKSQHDLLKSHQELSKAQKNHTERLEQLEEDVLELQETAATATPGEEPNQPKLQQQLEALRQRFEGFVENKAWITDHSVSSAPMANIRHLDQRLQQIEESIQPVVQHFSQWRQLQSRDGELRGQLDALIKEEDQIRERMSRVEAQLARRELGPIEQRVSEQEQGLAQLVQQHRVLQGRETELRGLVEELRKVDDHCRERLTRLEAGAARFDLTPITTRLNEVEQHFMQSSATMRKLQERTAQTETIVQSFQTTYEAHLKSHHANSAERQWEPALRQLGERLRTVEGLNLPTRLEEMAEALQHLPSRDLDRQVRTLQRQLEQFQEVETARQANWKEVTDAQHQQLRTNQAVQTNLQKLNHKLEEIQLQPLEDRLSLLEKTFPSNLIQNMERVKQLTERVQEVYGRQEDNEASIHQLRKQRRLPGVLDVVLLAGVAAVCLITGLAARGNVELPSTLEVQRLVLRDESNKSRAELFQNADGTGLVLFDDRANPRLTLGVTGSGPSVELRDETGQQSQVRLQTNGGQAGQLQLLAANQRAQVDLHAGTDRPLSLTNGNGVEQAGLWLTAQGSLLQLNDKRGQPRLQLGTAIPGEGLTILDEYGKRRVDLGLTRQGSALHLYDQEERQRIGLAHDANALALMILEPNGTQLASFGLTGDGLPILNLHDRTGIQRLALEVDEKHGGTFRFFDEHRQTVQALPNKLTPPAEIHH